MPVLAARRPRAGLRPSTPISSPHALLTWCWWWLRPVCTRSDFARLLAEPSTPLPRYPGRLLRACTLDHARFIASATIRTAPDEPAALALIASLPGLPRAALTDLVFWRTDRVLGDPAAALAVLRAPACSETTALQVVSACWFLGFGYNRFGRYAADRPSPELLAHSEASLLAALEPFPAARLAAEVCRVFPHTLPHELELVFPELRLLSSEAREVTLSLLRDDFERFGPASSQGRTAAEISELLQLATHCVC